MSCNALLLHCPLIDIDYSTVVIEWRMRALLFIIISQCQTVFKKGKAHPIMSSEYTYLQTAQKRCRLLQSTFNVKWTYSTVSSHLSASQLVMRMRFQALWYNTIMNEKHGSILLHSTVEYLQYTDSCLYNNMSALCIANQYVNWLYNYIDYSMVRVIYRLLDFLWWWSGIHRLWKH